MHPRLHFLVGTIQAPEPATLRIHAADLVGLNVVVVVVLQTHGRETTRVAVEPRMPAAVPRVVDPHSHWLRAVIL